ncbi:MAG: hypothetical protein H6Q33_4332 [Deltaproteobacteria bacterium]|nr:hypothetical protein [Deltaproteobacteria bacterium]
MASGLEHLIVRQAAGWACGEVVQIHHRTDDTAYGLRRRRDGKPFVQRPALIRFEVAEADPAQARGVQHRRDGVPRGGEHVLEAGMHEERRVILQQKLVELDAVLGRERRNTIQVGSNLRYQGTHLTLLSREAVPGRSASRFVDSRCRVRIHLS